MLRRRSSRATRRLPPSATHFSCWRSTPREPGSAMTSDATPARAPPSSRRNSRSTTGVSSMSAEPRNADRVPDDRVGRRSPGRRARGRRTRPPRPRGRDDGRGPVASAGEAARPVGKTYRVAIIRKRPASQTTRCTSDASVRNAPGVRALRGYPAAPDRMSRAGPIAEKSQPTAFPGRRTTIERAHDEPGATTRAGRRRGVGAALPIASPCHRRTRRLRP